MTLRVVGAGLGRTGTMSLKFALEKLLGGPCYHMLEVFARPDHVAMWHEALRGRLPVWSELFDGFVAAVDWPVVSFWDELAEANPDALIVLSVRDPEDWWRSCDRTIFEVMRRPGDRYPEWYAMALDMFARTFPKGGVPDHDDAIEGYEKHNDEVRRNADPSRLVEWRPEDGWEPICSTLGVPVPDEPFPRTNTTEEFRSRAGWDG
jgi:sulfotransferase family protein